MELSTSPSSDDAAVPDPLGIEGRIKARRRRKSHGGSTPRESESHSDATAIDTAVADEIYAEIPPPPINIGVPPTPPTTTEIPSAPISTSTTTIANPTPIVTITAPTATSIPANLSTSPPIPISNTSPNLSQPTSPGTSPPPIHQSSSMPLPAARERDFFVRDLLLVLRTSVLESLRVDSIGLRDLCSPDNLSPLTAGDFTSEITVKILLTDANTDWQMRDIAPRCFGRLRLVWGLSADSFLQSWPWRDELQLNQRRDAANFVLFSTDRRFMMRSITEKEFNTLRQMLPSYSSHMSANPHSLLPRYFGVHQLQAGGKKNYLVVQDSPVPISISAPNVTVFSVVPFDERCLMTLSPSSPTEGLARSDSSAPSSAASTPKSSRKKDDKKDLKKEKEKEKEKERKDTEADPLDRDREKALREMDLVPKTAKLITRAKPCLKELRTTRVIIPAELRVRLFEQLQRDSNFLITQEITDHQLLVSVVPATALEQHQATLSKPSPAWIATHKKSEGIVCFLKQRTQSGVKGSTSGAVVFHFDTQSSPASNPPAALAGSSSAVSADEGISTPISPLSPSKANTNGLRPSIKLRKNSGYRHRKQTTAGTSSSSVAASVGASPSVPESPFRDCHGGFRGVSLQDSASFYGDHAASSDTNVTNVYFIGFHDILQRADRKKKPQTVQRLAKNQQLEPVTLDLQGYARRICDIMESVTPVVIESGGGAYIEVNYG